MTGLPIRARKVMRAAVVFCAGSVTLILLVAATLLFLPQFWRPAQPPHTVVIARGMSTTQIASLLMKEDVLSNRVAFLLAVKLLRAEGRLKAGKYQLSPQYAPVTIVNLLRRGKVTAERVTIPEGADSWTIASILSRTVQVDSAAFVRLMHDSTLMATLGLCAPSLEGYLYPNTYQFYWGVSPEAAIRAMVAEFRRQVGDTIEAQARAMGWSLHQVVTLASIIEGEAMLEEERPLISAVYHNRLRLRMPLQADPTVQYLVPGRGRRLLKSDLAIDSPYNTYLYPGLPPGPVNNPGMRSIVAALHPAPVDYLYFVARGDGGHVFSRTLREHLRAKAQFDQVRRRVAHAGGGRNR
ncbi:MAG: endolytic transglycosylase MltG [candidate division KSB1 bacterium]|nr:endolytic transglycosylase MltG [candidate division KSB1 bacterium]MDZ7295114.1 endolytic transglycosylase MltG [candidate division KSB1 bacterium]MDZ7385019.1 endolytic transglycosylase MltG [candidate division KSB1 bacterium]MDZ7391694.1 endolytic transglycosylase MltG [candidate division KSB1 bacterium]MDZ7413517.1 endolytic transglycosylase MltG [candidate division KSB1 bacterium]